MLLPIGDENPCERRPYVNYTILALNIFCFVLYCFPEPSQAILLTRAMLPSTISFSDPSTWGTVFTSMFLHGDIFHLLGNMLFLWIAGDNVEDKLGHIPYAIFYLLCGVAASFLHVASDAASMIPTLGASGAISGVIATYVVFFPTHRIKIFIWVIFFFYIFYWPAWVAGGLWILYQVGMALMTSDQEGGGVAYLAHIGGFLTGIGIGFFVKYVLIPQKFGLESASHHRPRGLQGTSRRAQRRTRENFQPFASVEKPVDISVVRETEHQYAVIRTTEELHTIGAIASGAAPFTGESPSLISKRLNASRGMIAKNLTREQADNVYRALRRIGTQGLLVRYGPGSMPPTPVEVDQVSWDPSRIAPTVGDQQQPIPWSTPYLYLASVVCREPQLDVYVTPNHAFRVTSRARMSEVDPDARSEQPARLHHLAATILKQNQHAALNDGVRVMANRGSWGWLSFQDPSFYEDYAFWVYTLVTTQHSSRWMSR